MLTSASLASWRSAPAARGAVSRAADSRWRGVTWKGCRRCTCLLPSYVSIAVVLPTDAEIAEGKNGFSWNETTCDAVHTDVSSPWTRTRTRVAAGGSDAPTSVAGSRLGCSGSPRRSAVTALGSGLEGSQPASRAIIHRIGDSTGARVPSILVVDDDVSLLKTDIRALRRANFRVEAFDSPLQALLRLDDANRGFDLILTDFEMPDLDGIAFAKLAREKLGPACPPLILRSGVRPLPSEVKALFVFLLEKPLASTALVEHLSRAIELGPTRRSEVQLRPPNEQFGTPSSDVSSFHAPAVKKRQTP